MEIKPAQTLHLSIESKISDVSLIGNAVRGVCACSPLGSEVYGEMEVCVVEAVNNAITHAYRHQVGFRVEAAITLHRTGLPLRSPISARPSRSLPRTGWISIPRR
jgi:serine/threonine-protein kinase RsbW